MNVLNFRRLKKIIRNAANLLRGYTIYVDTDKLQLIDQVYRSVYPSAKTFADLGGVWNVNAAYTLYTLRMHNVRQGYLVDTDFPAGLLEKLSGTSNLTIVQGDFTSDEVVKKVDTADVVYFFDVLLHQANPSWDEVLSKYSAVASCIVIFNQQYVYSQNTIRLTDLPLEEYLNVAPQGREETYRYVYDHADEIHPTYGKPWRDIHNIFQWGITDRDLRSTMNDLGFREVYFKNCGRFSTLAAFENHAFIFVRNTVSI